MAQSLSRPRPEAERGGQAQRARHPLLVWGLRACVTVALVIVLVRGVDVRRAFAIFSALSPALVGAVVLLTAGAMLLAAVRWQRALRRLGEQMPLKTLLADTLVGSTYNVLLPTSVGGDVVRALRSRRRMATPSHAVAAIAFERAFGLLSLVLWALLGIALSAARSAALPVLVLAALLVAGLALVALSPRAFELAARVAGRASLRGGQALREIAAALSGPLGTRAARLEALAWSFAYQLVSLSILGLVLLEWQTGSLLGAYVGVPIALVVAMLPVTLGGIGLRESMFVVALEPFGIDAEKALALGLIWLASSLLVAVAGAFVLLGERR